MSGMLQDAPISGAIWGRWEPEDGHNWFPTVESVAVAVAVAVFVPVFVAVVVVVAVALFLPVVVVVVAVDRRVDRCGILGGDGKWGTDGPSFGQ
jgi:hypothetical protein